MRTVGATATATVRVLVELGAYTSLGYWGASVRGAVALRAALAVLAPLAAILVWARVGTTTARQPARSPGHRRRTTRSGHDRLRISWSRLSDDASR